MLKWVEMQRIRTIDEQGRVEMGQTTLARKKRDMIHIA
jgi:hypothetical protein